MRPSSSVRRTLQTNPTQLSSIYGTYTAVEAAFWTQEFARKGKFPAEPRVRQALRAIAQIPTTASEPGGNILKGFANLTFKPRPESPNAHTVLPTIGSMDDLRPDYSRNFIEVR